ncbi:MAG: class D sortase [Anaerolineales bacterium]|nr:class D sortase [Anaerolineales bacterium]
MAKRDKSAEELTVAELEALLARKKREDRQERIRRFKRSGRALNVERGADPADTSDPEDVTASETEATETGGGRRGGILDRALLGVEILAVAGLALVLVSGFGVLQELNQEVAEALGASSPTPTPLITAVVLPSGHTPPTSPGGAQPNESEIPEHLRPLVQSMGPVDVPTPGPEQARSIHIPRIWNSPAPVVQGDGWEQLKKGVGHHLGSANPGEKGNLVLSAHNDIFGELFRYLDRLQPGDEIIVSTATNEYVYRVTGMQVVEPTAVSVMEPTEKPTATLISCYPYLVDNKRIVVFAELETSG